MEKMAIESHKQTIVNLLQEGETILTRVGSTEQAKTLKGIRMEAEKKREPVVMFYGLYNAGKSTLGNALCNANLKVGDIPTTASIEKIHWAGYTLIDTPGINAFAAHTEIAENEIRQSDIILFVVDNADTFDTECVYEAIVKILTMGKPLAVVVNQKNVDDNEDPKIPVPQRDSIQKVVGKISLNLTLYANKHGLQIEKEGCFLGIYPVNAWNALKAWEKTGDAAERVRERNGLTSLLNAFNNTIRRSEVVYMLRTPLINLRDILSEEMEQYQSAAIYGEKQDMAKNRETLLASRQRLLERLRTDGFRKIEMVLEEVKAAAANGQSVKGADQKIQAALDTLIKQAAEQEGAILESEIKIDAMPDYQNIVSDEPSRATKNDDFSIVGDLAQIASFALDVIAPIPVPVPIPITIITAVVRAIIHLFTGGTSDDKSADDAAARSQEQLANYYRWLNELHDQEIKMKASYEKSINNFLSQYYDPKLAKIDQSLSELDDSCAEHTENLRIMEQLMMKVGDEILALAVVN